jgi:predicted Zn-dependent peptidase
MATTLAAHAQKMDAYEMSIEGVKVIVQPVNNQILEVQAVFKGGVQNYTATQSGIEALTLKALTECGTKNDDKNSFKNKLDKVNAQMYSAARMDYSSFKLNCIKEDFEIVWPLFVDALITPRFDEKEFKRIKDETLNNIREQNANPDNSISKMARETAFAGKKYAIDPAGSDAAVTKLTNSDIQNYYKSLATRSRMFLVVVGNIDSTELKPKLIQLLKAIPQGKPFVSAADVYTPKVTTFKVQKKDLATNYIEGVASGPAPGSKEFYAFQLAMRIFYNRHFLEIRTNNGLSYAPYSYFSGGLTPFSGIGVSTTDPNKYIQVLNKLIAKTKEGFTNDEVKDIKTRYVTAVYTGQESNSDQANALAANQVTHNNWRKALTLNDDLKNITAKDLTNTFNKHISKFTWVYQGNPALVNSQLFAGSPHKMQPLKPQKKEGSKLKK